MHGGGQRCDDILAAIDAQQADVVALQEFRHGKNGARLQRSLSAMGLRHCFATATRTARDNTLLVASRHPLVAKPWPASDCRHALQCQIIIDSATELNLLNLHLPQKRAQIPLFEAMLQLPPNWLATPSVLIGDFNCGIPFIDSDTKTFYASHLFQQLLSAGWIDSWRSRHTDAREFSWVSSRGNGFRYDHALGSGALDKHIIDVRYDHRARQQKVSDHSMLLLDIEPCYRPTPEPPAQSRTSTPI